MEELNCDTAFTIPLFGGIKISESVAVTWIIMAVVVLLCVIFVRNLSVENPGKAQLLLESAIGKGVDFFEDVMGRKPKIYPISYHGADLYRNCQYHWIVLV